MKGTVKKNCQNNKTHRLHAIGKVVFDRDVPIAIKSGDTGPMIFYDHLPIPWLGSRQFPIHFPTNRAAGLCCEPVVDACGTEGMLALRKGFWVAGWAHADGTILTGCAGSPCAGSPCAGSHCAGSHCAGSHCAGSHCAGSHCAGSLSAIPGFCNRVQDTGSDNRNRWCRSCWKDTDRMHWTNDTLCIALKTSGIFCIALDPLYLTLCLVETIRFGVVNFV